MTIQLRGVSVQTYDSGPETAPHKLIYFAMGAVTVVPRKKKMGLLYKFWDNSKHFNSAHTHTHAHELMRTPGAAKESAHCVCCDLGFKPLPYFHMTVL